MKTLSVWFDSPMQQFMCEYGPVEPVPPMQAFAGPSTRDMTSKWTVGLGYPIDDLQPIHTITCEFFELLPAEPDDAFLSVHKYEDCGDWFMRIEQGWDAYENVPASRRSWTYRIYRCDWKINRCWDSYLGVWPD